MCHFDNGACDGMGERIIIPGPEEDVPNSDDQPCYSNQMPRTVVDRYVCPDYKRETCCIFSDEIAYVKAQQYNYSTQCKVDSECQNVINRVLCAACSPRSNKYYHGGKLAICKAFANEMFDSCAGSQFYNEETHQCQYVSQAYNYGSFMDLFGTLSNSEDNCFDGIDAEPFVWETWLIAVICVGGVLVIAIIVVIIVVACCVKKKKGKKDPNNGEIALDVTNMVSANNMTLVPVDIVGDPDKGEIICIDDGQGVPDGTVPVSAVGTTGSMATMDGMGMVSTGVPMMTVQQPMMMTMQPQMMMTGDQQMMVPVVMGNMLVMSNGMMQPQMGMQMTTDMQMQTTDMQQVDQSQGQQQGQADQTAQQ